MPQHLHNIFTLGVVLEPKGVNVYYQTSRSTWICSETAMHGLNMNTCPPDQARHGWTQTSGLSTPVVSAFKRNAILIHPLQCAPLASDA